MGVILKEWPEQQEQTKILSVPGSIQSIKKSCVGVLVYQQFSTFLILLKSYPK